MIDSEKQKKLMLNENVFAKPKKLMLKHSKKKMNDEHENNNLALQVVVNFQDFQVYPYNVQSFQVSYIFFFYSGGMGGMGGGADLGGLGSVMNDPEILEALQDPDVQKAFSVRFCIHIFR
jgi:hypothetical protein